MTRGEDRVDGHAADVPRTTGDQDLHVRFLRSSRSSRERRRAGSGGSISGSATAHGRGRDGRFDDAGIGRGGAGTRRWCCRGAPVGLWRWFGRGFRLWCGLQLWRGFGARSGRAGSGSGAWFGRPARARTLAPSPEVERAQAPALPRAPVPAQPPPGALARVPASSWAPPAQIVPASAGGARAAPRAGVRAGWRRRSPDRSAGPAGPAGRPRRHPSARARPGPARPRQSSCADRRRSPGGTGALPGPPSRWPAPAPPAAAARSRVTHVGKHALCEQHQRRRDR